MSAVLALAGALIYGAADFVGGLTSRRSGTYAVVVGSQLAGLLLLLAVLPLLPSEALTWPALGWGAVAGLGGGAGVALLYRGLAIGRMSVVAPITAIGAATVPVVVGLVGGERPSATALLGVVLALIAVVLVSLSPSPSASSEHGRAEVFAATGGVPRGWRRPGLPEAIGAGLAFGAFFVLLDRAGDEALRAQAAEGGSATLWPLVGARSSIVLIALAALATRSPLKPAPGTWPVIALVGTLDMGANVLYMTARSRGSLALVAVLISLYPASTVLLARVVLRERLGRLQLGGLACAALGVVLIAPG